MTTDPTPRARSLRLPGPGTPAGAILYPLVAGLFLYGLIDLSHHITIIWH